MQCLSGQQYFADYIIYDIVQNPLIWLIVAFQINSYPSERE